MSKNISFCELIKQIEADPFKKIEADPFKKIEGLSVGYFALLRQHLQECEACSRIVDEVTDKYKDVPTDSNSDWNKTNYN